MQQTRVGFIGAGVIANRQLDNLLRFDDVQVVGLADPQVERASAEAGRCGGRVYSDYSCMLEAEKPDALYICVPSLAYGAPEEVAIERGLPFFGEKPVAVALETAETVARGVSAQGLVTAVGYHGRYLDTTERAGAAEREPRSPGAELLARLYSAA